MLRRRTARPTAASPKTEAGTGQRALDFLTSHGLEHTPEHYALAHRYLTGRGGLLARAVDAVVMSGSRLTPEEAEHIMALERVGGSANEDGEEEDARDALLRHHALALTGLTRRAAAETERFGRDLTTGLADLDDRHAPASAIMTDMIARSGDTGRALADALDKIESLREEVAAARGDAMRDALTGLPNRRGLEEEMRAIGTSFSGSVAMCDIDRFKAINDRWGHAVGDRVLRAVASVIGDECSPHSVVRWGGEEFVVIMQGIPPARAATIVERAAAKLAGRTFRVRETDEPIYSITISAGIAPLETIGLADAIAVADGLMYGAKRDGGNRVMLGERHLDQAA